VRALSFVEPKYALIRVHPRVKRTGFISRVGNTGRSLDGDLIGVREHICDLFARNVVSPDMSVSDFQL
jgi:hypothetical protein